MNNKNLIRWGVMGTARIATRVRKAIQQTEGAELTAIASRSEQRALQWATEHGAQRSYGTYQALLEDPDLDAVYIPLPPSLHAEWTIRAAEQGKHVLCEKPLAMDASQAKEMAHACREHGVQLMDAVMWVHHPRAADMMGAIQDDQLGILRRINAAFGCQLDHDPSLEFRYQRELGGGSLLDLGWYCIRAAMWAFGTTPQRVYSTSRYEHGVDVNMNAIMWYEGGRMASFDCGFDAVWRKWFEVVGTEGSLVCDDFVNPWNSQRPRYWVHDAQGNATEHVSAPRIQEQCMVENFCRIVRRGELDERWPQVSIDNQRVCDSLARSARKGEAVEVGE